MSNNQKRHNNNLQNQKEILHLILTAFWKLRVFFIANFDQVWIGTANMQLIANVKQ